MQFEEKTAIHLGSLVWIPEHMSTTEGVLDIGKSWPRGLHTILGKTSYTLIRLAKVLFCVSKYCDSAHNSRKHQLYTYKACKSTPLRFQVL